MGRGLHNPGRALVVAGLAGLGGCATDVPSRDGGPYAGNQGGSWEVVLPGRAVAQAEPGPEAGRRDEDLNIRDSRPRLALETWPEEDRPGLDRARRLSLPRRSHQYLYISDRPRREHRHHHHGWHGW